VAKWMEPSALAAACENIELVLFDTTCFWRGSGRIRRVLDWALGAGLPIVLVRSHTKLDSLGVEYGRIGSIVFAASRRSVPPSRLLRLREIIDYAADAVRLFGGAAIPAHFPPFVGRDTYGSLTASRIAAMLRNSRRMGRSFAAAFPGPRQVTVFQHGHYVTLAPMKRLDEIATKKLAGALSAELQAAGLPIRHAGSFGFDFAAVEWFRDTLMNRNVIRVSAPDLPASLADKITSNIIRWWSRNAGEPLPCLTSTSPRRVRLPTHGYFGDLAIGRPCHRRKTGCSIQNPG